MKRETRQDTVFIAVNTTFLLGITFLIAYPLVFVLSASLSAPYYVNSGQVFLYPRGLSLEGYTQILRQAKVWIGYRNTIIYTTVGTLFNLVVILTAAYALARSNLLRGVGIITRVLAFSMIFYGGLVPTYLLVKSLGMINTMWALVLPKAASVYLIIISRTFIRSSIPTDLYDAAEIDGASYTWIFVRVVLPLSSAIIAVVTLFSAVNHWNMFFSGLIYLTDEKKYPLQLILRQILLQNQQLATDAAAQGMGAEEAEAATEAARLAEVMKFTLIVIASAPILAVYPFLQKYFVRGVMIGSMKG